MSIYSTSPFVFIHSGRYTVDGLFSITLYLARHLNFGICGSIQAAGPLLKRGAASRRSGARVILSSCVSHFKPHVLEFRTLGRVEYRKLSRKSGCVWKTSWRRIIEFSAISRDHSGYQPSNRHQVLLSIQPHRQTSTSSTS